MVVEGAKRIERILREEFNATGNGINELIASISGNIINRYTLRSLRSVAQLRNRLVHEDGMQSHFLRSGMTRAQFQKMVEQCTAELQGDLRRYRSLNGNQAAALRIFGGGPGGQQQHPALRGYGNDGGGGGGGCSGGIGFGGDVAQGTGGAGASDFQQARSAASSRRPRDCPVPNQATLRMPPNLADSASFPHLPEPGADGSGRFGEAATPARELAKPRAVIISGRGVAVSAEEEYGANRASKFYQERVRHARPAHTVEEIRAAKAAAAAAAANGGGDGGGGGGGGGETCGVAGAGLKKLYTQVAFEGRGFSSGPLLLTRAAASGAAAAVTSRSAKAPALRRPNSIELLGGWQMVGKKGPTAEHWCIPNVEFNRGNCRGWFPAVSDWSAYGTPCMSFASLQLTTEARGSVFTEKTPQEEYDEIQLREALEKSKIDSEMEWLRRNEWAQRLKAVRANGGDSAGNNGRYGAGSGSGGGRGTGVMADALCTEGDEEMEIYRALELSEALRWEREAAEAREIALQLKAFKTAKAERKAARASRAVGAGGGNIDEDSGSDSNEEGDSSESRMGDGGAWRSGLSDDEDICKAIKMSRNQARWEGVPLDDDGGSGAGGSGSAGAGARMSQGQGGGSSGAAASEAEELRRVMEESMREEEERAAARERAVLEEEVQFAAILAASAHEDIGSHSGGYGLGYGFGAFFEAAGGFGGGGMRVAAAVDSKEVLLGSMDDVAACRSFFPEKFAQMLQLGLGYHERLCAVALRASGGNLDSAVEALLEAPPEPSASGPSFGGDGFGGWSGAAPRAAPYCDGAQGGARAVALVGAGSKGVANALRVAHEEEGFGAPSRGLTEVPRPPQGAPAPIT